jgi:hypothetical protein
MTREDQFESFWTTYPRRIGKGAARKSFEKALKLESFDGIMSGLRRQLAYYSSKEQQFIPHPTTWLNQERWSDEPQLIQSNTGKRTIADAARDFITSNDYRGDAFGFPSIGRH